jgi:hypothetical protein
VYLKRDVPAVKAVQALRAAWPKARNLDAPVVREAQFSYSELAEWQSRLNDVENRSGLVLEDIDERLNRLTIGVESAEAGGRLASDLAARGVPREAINIELVEGTRAVTQTIYSYITPTTAGINVRGFGLSSCTLGFNVKWNGVMHFVTASHCTSPLSGGGLTYPDMGVVTGVSFCQPGCNGNSPAVDTTLGPEVIDPPWHNTPGYWGSLCAANELCRMSDAAMVRYDYRVPTAFELANMLVGGSLDYYGGVPFVGEIIGNNQFVGDLVARNGVTSGAQYGTISRTCIKTDGYLRPGGKTMKHVCQNEMTGEAQPGDSGGPVSAYVGWTGPYLLGIVHSTRTGYTFYSPINNIQTDFGPYWSWQSH